MLNSSLNKVGVVVLAAGKGTRLNCVDKPKVMCEIGGRPIISYLVETLEKINFTPQQIVLVVGFHKEKIIEYFADRVTYAVQAELLGTAHAAFTGMKELSEGINTVLVINGDDSAFYSQQTIVGFIQKHIENKATLSLLSAEVENPTSLGRIIRHANGQVEIIEKEHITTEQEKITEINTNTFCFERGWYATMFPNMPQLQKLGEYALPVALAMASAEGKNIQVLKLKDHNEWFGINTPAELEEANRRKNNL